MTEIPDECFEIVKNQEGSSVPWTLCSKAGRSFNFGFEYATRVANGDRPEKIGLFNNGSCVSVQISKIDTTVEQLNACISNEKGEFDQLE